MEGGLIAGTHLPVMLDEVLTGLAVKDNGVYLDATFGRGGHAAGILSALGSSGSLICIDRDPAAISVARERFGADSRVRIFQAGFSSLAACADQVRHGLEFDGILFDLGVSSPQLDDAQRGFSFMQDGPLDMRMNSQAGTNAADVVNNVSERELTRIFRELGEERFAARIARAIVTDRGATPFRRTLDLAGLIARVVPARERHKHPATRVFQALRIFVNRELEELDDGLDAALSRLSLGGRLAAISFHSLEDRKVKRFMRRHASTDPMYAGLPDIPPHARPKLRLIGKSIEAATAEIEANPRARSARLRIAERIDTGLAA
jgi:16S rRNA (cytosine1402-N4)-methyltransferase